MYRVMQSVLDTCNHCNFWGDVAGKSDIFYSLETTYSDLEISESMISFQQIHWFVQPKNYVCLSNKRNVCTIKGMLIHFENKISAQNVTKCTFTTCADPLCTLWIASWSTSTVFGRSLKVKTVEKPRTLRIVHLRFTHCWLSYPLRSREWTNTDIFQTWMQRCEICIPFVNVSQD